MVLTVKSNVKRGSHSTEKKLGQKPSPLIGAPLFSLNISILTKLAGNNEE